MTLEALFVLVAPDLRPAARLLLRDTVEAVFPEAQLVLLSHAPGAPLPVPESLAVRVPRWLDASFEPTSLDAEVDQAARSGPVSIALAADDASTGQLAMAACQLLTRYQRLIDRHNLQSSTAAFQHLVEAHRAMHDLRRPLVAADYNHAIDTWRWVMRLNDRASGALQSAALLHDVERLVSEADQRLEQYAPDYQEFKDRHAAGSALIARELMEQAGFEPLDVAQAEALIRSHERAAAEADQRTLVDADCLSFFSLNACGFARHYGAAHTQLKLDWTLRRMSPAARRRISGIRHCAHVAAPLQDALQTMESTATFTEMPPRAAGGRPS